VNICIKSKAKILDKIKASYHHRGTNTVETHQITTFICWRFGHCNKLLHESCT